MLGTCSPLAKANWKEHVAPLVHAYNCLVCETTGYSPFYLMFGRQPRVAIDLLLAIKEDSKEEQKEHQTYMKQLKARLQHAFKLASEAAVQKQQKQKQLYDERRKGASLFAGDRILVRRTGFKGPHKLEDRWSEEVYVIKEQPDETIPVYRVQQEGNKGPIRTLHRNLLLPIEQLLLEDPPEILKHKASRTAALTAGLSSSSESEGSDSDLSFYLDLADSSPTEAYQEATSDPTIQEGSITPGSDVSINSHASEASNALEASGIHEFEPPVGNTLEGTTVSDEESDHQELDNSQLRRSRRIRRPPAWMSTGEFDF